MPKVSVIIPVYNVEKYLRECLDSVLNQTLSDIEIIIIDDGGKDNCPQFIGLKHRFFFCKAWNKSSFVK